MWRGSKDVCLLTECKLHEQLHFRFERNSVFMKWISFDVPTEYVEKCVVRCHVCQSGDPATRHNDPVTLNGSKLEQPGDRHGEVRQLMLHYAQVIGLQY